MLNVGIIGYGGRVSSMAKALGMFGIPYRVAAITDPRAAEIQAANDPFLEDTIYYDSAEAMLAAGGLDGVMIGTRCHLHTDMACLVAQYKLPLFLEKPVATTFDQIKRLDAAFRNYPAPTVVSFPLRLTVHIQTIKEMIEAGTIGQIEQVVAFNDVPYGDVYFYHWYRNYELMGGLFLQKATHDLDYITYVMGQKPKQLCAMKALLVYGGDKPHDLRCVDCDEFETCSESPFNLFYERFQGMQVNMQSERMCVFSKEIRNEDISSVIIEYEDGAQVSYTQNVFARNAAGQRGARFYGYEGTIFFDWYENVIKVFKHRTPAVDTITFTGEMPHFGGDRELCLDFLHAMRDGTPSRSPIEAGVLSALTCLWARESAETRCYCDVVMPS
ncbi:MAG: Gfo/Idh/MocA family oxidoreductase [Chloroflexi bacterium]|nr:Gfo/Idh/MocA family oxidoreductase [Chloroflexota bacterium]